MSRIEGYKYYCELRRDRFSMDMISGYGFQVYSMQDQDGIIDYLLRYVKDQNRVFIEFGAGDGIQNNTLYLHKAYGWKGLWIEGDPRQYGSLKELNGSRYKDIHLEFATVNKDNVDPLLKSFGCDEPDVLSIDVDGNDYWLWSAIKSISPKIVVIEYNSHYGARAKIIQEYVHGECKWNGSMEFGSSFESLRLLGLEKDYKLMCCNIGGSDMFFMRSDIANKYLTEKFVNKVATNLGQFEEPKFDLCYRMGHDFVIEKKKEVLI